MTKKKDETRNEWKVAGIVGEMGEDKRKVIRNAVEALLQQRQIDA